MNQHVKSTLVTGLLLGVSTFSNMVKAESPIMLKSTAQIERTIKQADGTQIKHLEDFKTAPPGQEVVFTNTMTNVSKKAADNLVLVNPVPPNMVLSKVWGNESAIKYSVDGKTFAKAEELKVVNQSGLSRAAVLTDYKSIQWTVNTLKAGETVSVGFNAVIK